jgi:drug/metabolite transporter (DMT)-like permease
VAEVALLLSTTPLFVLTLRRIRGDVPMAFEVLGASLAVAGIALILAPRLILTERFVNARLTGDVLAICAAVLTALYAYLYRYVAKTDVAPEPTSVTIMTFALGSAVLIGILCLVPTTVSLEAFTGRNLLIFSGLAVLCTAIPPAVTAIISVLIPLFGGTFAYVILGEKVQSTAIREACLSWSVLS